MRIPKPLKHKPKNRIKVNAEVEKQETHEEDTQRSIDTDLQKNKTYIQELFQQSSDIIIHEFQSVWGTNMVLLKVDGLSDTVHFDDNVMRSLMYGMGVSIQSEKQPPTSMEEIEQRFISIGQTQKIKTLNQAIDVALSGDTILLIDGFDTALAVSVKKWEHRSPDEPSTEAVVRGPREGFVESIRTNTALVRRRIRTPNLCMESFKIGRISKTDVVLSYIKGIATDSVVEELRKRLSSIDIDAIMDSGYIIEFIEDEPYSLFPQIQSTERPDTAAASMVEGRCLILVDGSPFGLIAPVNLWGALQANEDYYQRFLAATIIRWIRFIFTIIALLLPSMYIAITTFHQEMLPTNLVLSLAAARESSPFPALVEAFLMEITFEALREAGVRLPKAVGQAVSIVGALVIGQAAVQAGIISAPMVIIVSLTGIANFTIPRYEFALGIRMVRFPLMFLAGTFGLYGIVIGLIVIIGHLCAMRSVGVPFVAPIAPLISYGLRDTLVRGPWYLLRKRPRMIGPQNQVRMSKGQKPTPPNKGES